MRGWIGGGIKAGFIALLTIKVFGLTFNSAQAKVPDEPTEQMVCGTWTWYAPGVMDRARQNHGLGVCEDCAGLAVTVDQRYLGERIEVWYSGAWRGVFQVADVGQPGKNRRGLVGEVEAETAWEWGRAGPWWGCYREKRATP